MFPSRSLPPSPATKMTPPGLGALPREFAPSNLPAKGPDVANKLLDNLNVLRELVA